MPAVKLTSQTFGEPEKPPLVLIHGWGNHAGIWQFLIQALEKQYCIQAVDLPGYGHSPSAEGIWQQHELVEALITNAPDNAVWCGWSLGGMLATAVASRLSEPSKPRVRALITLCANPLFVRDDTWPHAMSRTSFRAFETGLKIMPETTLKHFQGLMVKGGIDIKADLRALKLIASQTKEPSIETLVSSLNLLKTLDNRVAIQGLTIPQLHLFGENDALVPAAVSQDVRSLNPGAQADLFPGAGHVPQLSHVGLLAERISRFLRALAVGEQGFVSTSNS